MVNYLIIVPQLTRGRYTFPCSTATDHEIGGFKKYWPREARQKLAA